MWLRAAAAFALLVSIGGASAPQGELIIVKKGASVYHWPGCSVVRNGDGVLAMNRGQAELRGLKPHPDCDPSKAPAAAPGRPGRGTGKLSQPAPPYVFVDGAGKYYHRERCARLERTPRKVVLDASTARKYWPCPACKPPIRQNKR